MNIQKATSNYEQWIARGLPLPPGLDAGAVAFKHEAMKGGSAFPFLRATFFRWAQRWREESGALGQGPQVLAVGDLHLENFGTWRDTAGRWIWGINDFDEAWHLPWTSDLVRLGVSASLALDLDGFSMDAAAVCRLILDGYSQGMNEPAGGPFDLETGHDLLRKMAKKAAKSEEKFWLEFEDPDSKWQPVAKPPAGAELVLRSALPPDATVQEFRVQAGPYEKEVREPSGLGSLGRPRYCVLAVNAGERLVREAKALLPSAIVWAASLATAEIKIAALLQNAQRRPDPYFRLSGQWTARRVAPDTVKISLKKLKKEGFAAKDQEALFQAMGRETANIHLGSGRTAEIQADLRQREADDANWFAAAVADWREKGEADWKKFGNDEP